MIALKVDKVAVVLKSDEIEVFLTHIEIQGIPVPQMHVLGMELAIE